MAGLGRVGAGVGEAFACSGRTRRLGSLTSTSTARGMEDIVRHCHGHREIITDASVVELRFHSRSSFQLEQLEIKAWRGATKAGPARSDQRLTARRTPRFAVMISSFGT